MKHVLITGAASGIGKATTRYLADRGFVVHATDINPAGLHALQDTPNIRAHTMDVTSEPSVRSCYSAIRNSTGRLDALVNAAGTYLAGPMTEISTAQFEMIVAVNLTGTYRVTRTFFPLLQSTGGRVVNIGSETYKFTNLFGHYAITKRALEAYTDALRQELHLLGMRVISIQPGAHETGVLEATRQPVRAGDYPSNFDVALRKFHAFTLKKLRSARDPVEVAKVVFKAITAANPRAVYRVNNDPVVRLLAFLPHWMVNRINKQLLG